MVTLVPTDSVLRVAPGTTPNYDAGNTLVRLLGVLEAVNLAADRENYDPTSLQYLFPLTWLQLYGPAAPNSDVLDATQQDVKTDFQKQNVADFRLGDTAAVRGWATSASGRVPFVQLSYRGGPDSALSSKAQLGATIGCVVSIPGGPSATFAVPYDPISDRYSIELWGQDGGALGAALGPKGQASLAAGTLVGRPDVVLGSASAFTREQLDGADLRGVAPQHAMHPVRPYFVDVRWTANADGGGPSDPDGGSATRLGFEMHVRGWNNFLTVGDSPNPHGGVGRLEYRNLFSHYGQFQGSGELDRRLEPWNFDAMGVKGHASGDTEPFLAVAYMDLHVLEPACGIGLHRHRDNQEIFLMLDGDGLMVVGDWADSGTRARAFEIRRLLPGSLCLLKGGNLHGLMNPLDRRSSLFMLGGYD